MSLVVISEALPGAVNTAGVANTTLTSWEDVSEDIDAQNIREEGIARRNIRYAAITPPANRHRYNTDERTAAFQQSAHGNLPIILGWEGAEASIGIGPIVYDNDNQPDDMGTLRFSCEYALNPNGSSLAVEMFIRLAYIVGTANIGTDNWTSISETLRRVAASTHVNARSKFFRGSVTIAHKFNPAPTVTTDELYFAVLVNLLNTGDGQSGRLRNASLEFHTFRK